MHQDEQVALIRRALGLIDVKSSERGEPATSPVQRYLDPARFQREDKLRTGRAQGERVKPLR